MQLFNYRLMRMDCIKKVIGDIVMKVNQNVQYQTKNFFRKKIYFKKQLSNTKAQIILKYILLKIEKDEYTP